MEKIFIKVFLFLFFYIGSINTVFSSEVESTVYFCSDSVGYAYDKPYIRSKIIEKLNTTDPLIIKNNLKDWYLVSTPSGKEGYVSKKSISFNKKEYTQYSQDKVNKTLQTEELEKKQEVVEEIIFGELLPPLNEREILGIWEAPYLKCTWSFEICNSKIYRVTRCSDGSGGNDGEPIIQIGNNKYKEVNSNYGEYFQILPDGQLGCYDNQGYISTLKKLKTLFPWKNTVDRSVDIELDQTAINVKTKGVAGDYKIIGDNRFGCVNKEYFDKLTKLVSQGDKNAFGKGLVAGLTTGQCVMFHNGEEVFLEDTKLFSGMAKIRKTGEFQGYWTVIETIKN